jgi:2'-5' RNA ligase
VETGDRLRLFSRQTIDPVVAWQLRELVPAAGTAGRIVPPENLHLTLAFLGSQAADDLPAIAGALRAAVAGGDELCLQLRGYRETRSVGMLTFDDVGGHAGVLAVRVHEALEALGVYEPEARPWLPHLTVLRFRERPRLRPALPELREVVPSDAAVFISRLRPGGAVYEAVEHIPLRR